MLRKGENGNNMNRETLALMLEEISSLEKRIYEREVINVREHMAIAEHEKTIKENDKYMTELKNSLRMFKLRLGMI